MRTMSAGPATLPAKPQKPKPGAPGNPNHPRPGKKKPKGTAA
jgi:hypothetical protein